MAPLRTYIVEDNAVIRESLIAMLEQLLPVKVVGHAQDEATAVQWLREPAHDCHLGIVDLFLQQGSGVGVLRSLPGAARRFKLVVLSNFATPEMRRRCLELGADEVFDKSNDIEELIRYCERLAAQRGAASPA